MTIHIRQATIQDLERLVPLFDAYRQFYGRPSDTQLARSFLLERFRHQQSIVFLAGRDGGAELGFTQLYPSFSSLSAARTYILNDLFVDPTARRMGVAALLLEAATAFGRSAGAVRLSLATAVDNAAARRLYERLGWKLDADFCHYELVL